MTNRFARPLARLSLVTTFAFVLGVLGAGLLAPAPTAAQEPSPGNTPSCQDRCQQHAQEVLKRCEAAGGENCATRAREALASCSTRCTASGGPAPACADRCKQSAEEALKRCEAAGGENCAARARAAYNACAMRCSNTGTVRPACPVRCREAAQAALRRCTVAGGENCAARAREMFAKCAEQCVREPGTGSRP